MALEWVRRRDPELDKQLRLYLFTSGPIVSVEEADDDASRSTTSAPEARGLGIGSLRGPR